MLNSAFRTNNECSSYCIECRLDVHRAPLLATSTTTITVKQEEQSQHEI